MILIQNGRVLDPVTNTDQVMDVLLDESGIVKTGEHLEAEGADVIDASGLVVAPGLMDAHVHFRDPGLTYKEDIFTGAAAAARGGFTTVVCMANTKPTVDNVETLDLVQKKGEKALIHVLQAAAISKGLKGEELTDMEALAKAGAVGFTDDGKPLLDAKIARKAMQEAARVHKPISFHEENPAYIQNNGVNAGKASEYFGIGGSDRQAEIDMVRRDLSIALETGAEIVIQHISAAEAVELVRQAKKKSTKIHAEATPHHFTLTEDAVMEHGTMAKMNPPLRTEADRQAIIRGLQDGTIDLIATDHAPHADYEKAKPLTEAPSGIIGLETSLALGNEALVDTGELTMMQLLTCMTINPAKLYRLDAGYLAENGPADLVLFDPAKEWIPERFYSKSQNSPFLGQKLKGKVEYTICKGKVIFEA